MNVKGRKAKLTWNLNGANDGYQIAYALNRQFTKGKKTKKVSWYKTSITLKKLKKKKTYYFKMRAYAYDYNIYKNVYGNWSGIKKVKIKK